MLRDIIAEMLASAPDMEMIGAVVRREALLPLVRETHPDVVILEMIQPDRSDECRALLYSEPTVRALAISRDGRESFLYALKPEQVPLGNISREGLLRAIRAATRPEQC